MTAATWLEPGIVEARSTAGFVQASRTRSNLQLAYDEAGQAPDGDALDYALAAAADAPRTFEIRHLESPTPLNPLGAKGAGEGGIMPVHSPHCPGYRGRAVSVRRPHRPCPRVRAPRSTR